MQKIARNVMSGKQSLMSVYWL